MTKRIRVTVWNEYRPEQSDPKVAAPGEGPVMKLGESEPPLEKL